MKDTIMMSIYSRHNRCNVSMYDSNTYKGIKNSVIEIDATLYRDLSVEFGLIRMALGMIHSAETLVFHGMGKSGNTKFQSKKVVVTTHYEGYSSDITMYINQENYHVNQIHYDDYVLGVEVLLDRYNQFRVAMDKSYDVMLKYMRHILQSVLETLMREYLHLDIEYGDIQSRVYQDVVSVLKLQCKIITESVPLDILHSSGFDVSDTNTTYYEDGNEVNGIGSISVVMDGIPFVTKIYEGSYDVKFGDINGKCTTIKMQLYLKILCTTKSLLETISSFMERDGRYVRGVYGIWGNTVGTTLTILHKQILDINDMLVFYKDGVHYNYYDVVDTYDIVRIPVMLFQKRVMLNTVIQLQGIKDKVYGYVDGILDTVYDS